MVHCGLLFSLVTAGTLLLLFCSEMGPDFCVCFYREGRTTGFGSGLEIRISEGAVSDGWDLGPPIWPDRRRSSTAVGPFRGDTEGNGTLGSGES